MIELVAEKPLDYTPGTNWSYSNTGYILLGMISEASLRVTGIFFRADTAGVYL